MNCKLLKTLLRTYYVPGSIPDVGEMDVNKTDRAPTPWGKGRKCGRAVNHNHRQWKVPGESYWGVKVPGESNGV